MKARDSALRLKRFDVAEKARKLADLDRMVREFEGMVTDLERQVTTEEERTGIRDPGHFAYSTFAKSVTVRREKLTATIDGVKAQLDAARREHDESVDDLQRMEAADSPGASTIGRNKTKLIEPTDANGAGMSDKVPDTTKAAPASTSPVRIGEARR